MHTLQHLADHLSVQGVPSGTVVLQIPLGLAIKEHAGDEDSNKLLYKVRVFRFTA